MPAYQSGAGLTDTLGWCAFCRRRGPARQITHACGDLPLPHVCDYHWPLVQSDWLLVGWCLDHYGTALTFCEVHHRTIPPV